MINCKKNVLMTAAIVANELKITCYIRGSRLSIVTRCMTTEVSLSFSLSLSIVPAKAKHTLHSDLIHVYFFVIILII